MSTPLEVIEAGIKNLKGRVSALDPIYFCSGGEIDDLTWKHDKKGTQEMVTANILDTLVALHDELEGKKLIAKTAAQFINRCPYNEAIQDQQDNLQALMDKIRV